MFGTVEPPPTADTCPTDLDRPDVDDPERYLWPDDLDPADPTLTDADLYGDPDSTDAGGSLFDDLPTGARLALRCEATADLAEHLSDADVLYTIAAFERMRRWADAHRTRLIATYADRHPAGTTAPPPGATTPSAVTRWVPDELGMTLHLSRLEARSLIAAAQRLTHVLPDTLDALQAGRIDERRADTISFATAALPDDKARAVEATVLTKADGATHRQLYDRTRRAVHRIDPDGAYRRHQKARQDRRVTLTPREDAMAALWAYGPATDNDATFTMLTRLAHSLGAADPRTLDQRRFDLLHQIVQGRITVTDLTDLDTVLAATQTAPAAQTAPEAAASSGDTAATRISSASTSDASTCDATGADPNTAGTSTAQPFRAGAENCAGAGHADAAADPEVSAEAGTEACTDPGADPEAGVGAGADPGRSLEPSSTRPGGYSGGGANDSPQPVPDEHLVAIAAAALQRQPRVADTVHKPLIHVVVGLDTLLGSDRPAELVGHGPIPAITARALTAGGTLRRLVVDRLSGALLDHGRTTYAPPAALADFVRARDQTCRGPGCTRPVRELDHHTRWEHDGDTDDENLCGYCRTHHVLKELDGWHVLAHTDGTLTWISPAGHRQTTQPYDYRPFIDDHPVGRETARAEAMAADPESDDHGQATRHDPDEPDEDEPPF